MESVLSAYIDRSHFLVLVPSFANIFVLTGLGDSFRSLIHRTKFQWYPYLYISVVISAQFCKDVVCVFRHQSFWKIGVCITDLWP